MTDHCGNPDCTACNYRRDHPEDPYHRITLIYASLLRATVGAMDEATILTEKAEQITSALGVGSEVVYNSLFNRQLAAALPNYTEDVSAAVAVLASLLPPQVFQHAKEVYESATRAAGREKIAEGGVTQEDVESAVARSMVYIQELVVTGSKYLTDVQQATHSAPGSLQ